MLQSGSKRTCRRNGEQQGKGAVQHGCEQHVAALIVFWVITRSRPLWARTEIPLVRYNTLITCYTFRVFSWVHTSLRAVSVL